MLANLESPPHVTGQGRSGRHWCRPAELGRRCLREAKEAILSVVETPESHHSRRTFPHTQSPILSPQENSTREVGATGMPALHHETEDTAVLGKVKEALIQRIGHDRYTLWFQSSATFRIESGTVVVEVAGDFALQRLRLNYFRHIEAAVAQAIGRVTPIRLQLASVSTSPADTAGSSAPPSDVPQSTVRKLVRRNPSLHARVGMSSDGPVRVGTVGSFAGSSKTASRVAVDSPVAGRETASVRNPTLDSPAVDRSPSPSELMTFANFAAGGSNALAHTAAQLLAAQPQQSAPLCFWGATGTGKTHLLNAIRHELRIHHRMQRVILLSAEDFTNDFLVAVRGAGLPAFRKRYRDVDALLIDNIQFFGGKSATLREVLYTVDTIISRRRPLVLAGDRPPTEIDGLSSELAGRMASGLVCGLNPLELELRRELFRRESMKSFMPWDEATVHSLATRINGDGRLIQGIGRLVSMLQRMYRRMPTMEEIVREAGDMLLRGPKVVALADIEKAVCAAFGLPDGELRSETKSRNVSQPRILAMYLARQHTNAAFSEIGRYFGDRNHSTVIAAYRRTESWLQTNQHVGGRGPRSLKVQEAIDAVENLLRIG